MKSFRRPLRSHHLPWSPKIRPSPRCSWNRRVLCCHLGGCRCCQSRRWLWRRHAVGCRQMQWLHHQSRHLQPIRLRLHQSRPRLMHRLLRGLLRQPQPRLTQGSRLGQPRHLRQPTHRSFRHRPSFLPRHWPQDWKRRRCNWLARAGARPSRLRRFLPRTGGDQRSRPGWVGAGACRLLPGVSVRGTSAHQYRDSAIPKRVWKSDTIRPNA